MSDLNQRLAKLDLELVKDDETLYLCSKCVWQSIEEKPGKCPKCSEQVNFVKVNQEFRAKVAEFQEKYRPEKWEANYAIMMQALNARKTKLPKVVQDEISDGLRALGPKVKRLATPGQDFDDLEWSRRLRELYVTMLGHMLDVAEKAIESTGNKLGPRIKLLN